LRTGSRPRKSMMTAVATATQSRVIAAPKIPRGRWRPRSSPAGERAHGGLK
jgi:hypothetical protein